MRIPHRDRRHTRLLRGIVISAREDRVSDENHASNCDAKGLVQLSDAVALVDAGPRDVYRCRATYLNGKARDQRLKKRNDLLALLEAWVPFFLLAERCLLTHRGNVIWLPRSSTTASLLAIRIDPALCSAR